MKRSPIKRKTPLKRSAMRRAKRETLRIGRMEYKIPAGTAGLRREIMIDAAEDHALASGALTLADAAPIIRKRERRIRQALGTARRRSAYASRERDTEYMRFVKTLTCAASSATWAAMPWHIDPVHVRCRGPIEADHMGARGVGRKADDRTCVPMCQSHHRDRTDHAGLFKHATKDQLRTWRAQVIAETQAAYARR